MTLNILDSSEQKSDNAAAFISYSRKDMQFVEAYEAHLRSIGINAYLDKKDIAPGEPWKERLSQLIAQADAVIYIMTPNSLASEICGWEVAESERFAKKIVPVLRTECDASAAPDPLRRLNWIFCRNEDERIASATQVKTVIEQDLGWVREHARQGQLAGRWIGRGRGASFLLRGPELEEAERWRNAAPPSAPPLTSEQAEFLEASRKSTTTRQRRLMAGALVGIVLAVGLAVFSFLQRNEAVAQRSVAETQTALALTREQEASEARKLAEKNESLAKANETRANTEAEVAKTQRDSALRSQSLLLTDRSQQKLKANDAAAALLLALEAVPDKENGPAGERPFVVEAAVQLYESLGALRERRASPEGEAEANKLLAQRVKLVGQQVDLPGGGRVEVSGADLSIRRIKDGPETVRIRTDHQSFDTDKLQTLGVLSGGAILASIAHNRVALYDSATYAKITEFKASFLAQDTVPAPVSISANGQFIAIPSTGDKIVIWDAKTRKIRTTLGPFNQVNSLHFDSTGDILAIGAQELVFWSLSGNKVLTKISGRPELVGSVLYPSRGKAYVRASWGEKSSEVTLSDSGWAAKASGPPCPPKSFCYDSGASIGSEGAAILTMAEISKGTADPNLPTSISAHILRYHGSILARPKWKTEPFCLDECRVIDGPVLEADTVCLVLTGGEVRRWRTADGAAQPPSKTTCQGSKAINLTGEYNVTIPRDVTTPADFDERQKLMARHILEKGWAKAAITPALFLYAAPLSTEVGSTDLGETALHRWRFYQDFDAGVRAAKDAVATCLTLSERRDNFLSEEPPMWCIDMKKHPYHERHDWRTWAAHKRAGKNPPPPDTLDWSEWLKKQPDVKP